MKETITSYLIPMVLLWGSILGCVLLAAATCDHLGELGDVIFTIFAVVGVFGFMGMILVGCFRYR